MAIDINRAKDRVRNTVPSKNNPLYNSHLYWSQKAYNICDILIEELSEEGDIVYDPFLGSGVTLMEAVRDKYKRKAAGCEINEAPVSIVKTLLSGLDMSSYQRDVASLMVRLKELENYYTTQCSSCGGTAIITTVQFDLINRDSQPDVKKINYICPNCKKGSKKANTEDLEKMTKTREVHNIVDEIMFENSKLAVYKDEKIQQIFTARNYVVIDKILGMINDYPENCEVFRYVLMSILHLCKITDSHSNSQWPLWIPKTGCVEKNVLEIFSKKLKKFEKTISYVNDNYSNNMEYTILNKGSQFVTNMDIEDESISLIITDPPYMGQVAYSEYMQLYKPFLGYKYNLDDEIIVTSAPGRKRTEEDYFEMLNQVFKICSKKLKTGGYFCMYFHDANLSVWNRLIKCMGNNHFRYLSQEHIKKSNTLKNIISPKKSLSGDAILFFVKEEFHYKEYDPTESLDEIEANIAQHIKKTIISEGEKSTPELYDEGLIEYLIYNDWLDAISKKYKTLVDIFEKYLIWNPETNKWYLAK